MELLLLIQFLSVTLCASISTETDTLVLLHVLFRHGNKAPDANSQFPTDPYVNKTFSPSGPGQLTAKGKRTEFEIGQYLRKTYDGFIPEQYGPETVYAVTTDFKRTEMSLETVLAGVFPPLKTDIFASGLNWQPTSFKVDKNDHLVRMPTFYCASYVQQYYKYICSTDGQKIVNKYQNLYQQLSNYTGTEITLPEDVFNVYVTLESEESLGLELPEWTVGLYPEILEEAAAVYLEFSAATTDLKKLSAGRLLKKIIDDSLANQNGTLSEARKMFLYSAHEYNIGVVLETLGLFHKHIPPYGATIFFEIHNIDGVYGLKLYYQTNREEAPQLLIVPGCKTFCPLDDFVKLMGNNFPGENDTCNIAGDL